MVFRLKVFRRRAREFDFAESSLFKCDGKRLRRAMFFASKRNDRTAICAATQVAARHRLFTIDQVAMDRRSHAFAEFARPMRYAAILTFWIFDVPILLLS